MSPDDCHELLLSRRHASGGFLPQVESKEPRPDATSWAVLALRSAGREADFVQAARLQLVGEQSPDGSVRVGPYNLWAYWPTPLALLAWHGWQEGAAAAEKALSFLDGVPARNADPFASVNAINSRLSGWSWIAASSCWVEPTSLCLFAFQRYRRNSARGKEAVLLLKDRELSKGGWNYGNTVVLGTELFPAEEYTGLALTALAGAGTAEIPRTVAWLEERFSRIRTPLTLAWAILGLSAWGRRPPGADEAIAKCLDRQSIVGPFDTTHLALLQLASRCPSGLAQLFTA